MGQIRRGLSPGDGGHQATDDAEKNDFGGAIRMKRNGRERDKNKQLFKELY